MPTLLHNVPGKHYSQDYKDQLFFMWWKGGKPSISRFMNMIPLDDEGNKPSVQTITNWIREDFKPRSAELDEEMYDEVKAVAVQEKVEMLQRHAEIGTTIQDYALAYLQSHVEDLSVNTATRLLIEGVRIERESRGIPTAIEKLTEKSDEELLKELEKVISSATIEIKPIERDDG